MRLTGAFPEACQVLYREKDMTKAQARMTNIFSALEKIVDSFEGTNETSGEYLLRLGQDLVNLVMFANKCKNEGAAVEGLFEKIKSNFVTKIACFENYMFSVC
jgi:hypothetical protein